MDYTYFTFEQMLSEYEAKKITLEDFSDWHTDKLHERYLDGRDDESIASQYYGE